jgi:TRAP-type mannitol/chloroaromatic compound transport system substrate-binding protein
MDDDDNKAKGAPAEIIPEDRRAFLKTAGIAGAIALTGVLAGCDEDKKKGEETAKAATDAGPVAATKITWKMQTAWDAGTVGFAAFEKFARSISELTGGKLEIDPQPNNAVSKTFEAFSAVKNGDLDGMHSFPIYWTKDMPVAAFLCSYPLALDRPDQWETWYYELGGLDIARKAYEANNIHFVGPVQHDLNLIHSKIPLRSFEDFKKKKIRFPGGMIGDVFKAAGVDVATFPGGKVYGALKEGQVDAADFTGPAVNFNLGFADVAKYIIMGPPSTPCLHQPCDLMAVSINLKKWHELSPQLQAVFTAAVRKFSWDHYAYIQKENIKAWGKFRDKGVEIIRLTEADISKFRRVAVPLWFQWAKKDALATQAFKSQLDFMRSDNIAYVNDAMLVDEKGQKLSI